MVEQRFLLLAAAATFVVLAALGRSPASANFYDDTTFTWGPGNGVIWGSYGENLALTLNHVSGSGIVTKNEYLFGSMEMHIKLVAGNSAGTVTAYYMSSMGSQHDEIDFEFLGNVSGQPYIIHTNVFAQGVGNREQQFYPWFDPTTDFHNYTIHWNPSEIVWFVDGTPIKVFRNYEQAGIPFPNKQPMKAYSSIWNADNWATRGGLVKIDWTSAPFVARYTQFHPRACVCSLPNIYPCTSAAASPANWWASPAYGRLSAGQIGQMNWFRTNHMIYDYCKDYKRFAVNLPRECSMPQF